MHEDTGRIQCYNFHKLLNTFIKFYLNCHAYGHSHIGIANLLKFDVCCIFFFFCDTL